MKKITLLMAALAITVVAMAQAMSGTYKVGTTEVSPNFASLSAAVAALNTNGVSGDVVLEITSDISETANIGLGVNTKGFSITIRPDADVDRTITFTQLTDNTSPTGHFVIGYLTTGLTAAWSDANTIGTSNVTIDGYAVGGTTKRLKFTNTNASHTNARVIVVLGASNNVTVKNCIIENKTTHNGSPFCIGAVVRKGAAIEVAPSNFIVENNTLLSMGNTASMGIRITNSGTLTTGYPVVCTGLLIKNNTITSRRRLLEINYTTGAEISGNSFTTEQTGTPGTISYGLWTSTGVTGTVKIYSNKFLKSFTEETGAFGHRVVSLSSGATYEIYNNTFAGMDKTKASSAALNLTYLFYSGVAGKIYNNTFYMPALTNATHTGGYYRAINLSGNTAEIKNNIFVSDEATHTNTSFISAIPTPATNYNNFYQRATNANAKVVGTYADLASYQAANLTKDVNSKSIDVNFVNAATGDLHIAGSSIDDFNMAAPMLATVATDIDGDARTALTYIGADQASDLTLVAKQFKVTVPKGTSKVYVVGSFTGKNWDIADPFALKATGVANEFGAILPCVDGVGYKYLCEKGDWDYQEAVFDGGNPPLEGTDRSYSVSDNVSIWFRVNKITLNTTFATAVPNTLFVKGSFDAWAAGHEMTKNGSTYSIVIGGNAGDKYPANTEYKYYTNDMSADNWESNSDGSNRDNRWAIAPVMDDEIARFVTAIPQTGVDEILVPARIMRTSSGIEVMLDGQASIELYSISGALLDKTVVSSSYSKALNSGIYIIRVNGVSTKFVK